jgi:hypothetical protein
MYIKQSRQTMSFTKPIYSKSEVLELAGISSSQFNNWMIRGLIPRSALGFELVKITKARYSALIPAYCKLMTYHTGHNRKQFIKELNKAFDQFISTETCSEHLTIGIAKFGNSADCGLFQNEGQAYALCPKDSVFVPVGRVIKQFIENLENPIQQSK